MKEFPFMISESSSTELFSMVCAAIEFVRRRSIRIVQFFIFKVCLIRAKNKVNCAINYFKTKIAAPLFDQRNSYENKQFLDA